MDQTVVSSEACVVATPASCLQDDEVVVTIQGLNPHQDVTLCATTTDVNGVLFCAIGHYRSDGGGNLSTAGSESVGGSYTGVWTMGLISALKPAPHERQTTRFFKKRADSPNHIKFLVHTGHLDLASSCSSSNIPLCSTSHVRHYMGPGVTRTPVSTGKLRAAFFLPPGEGPFPGVVDVFGTAGGLMESRAAQLASRGFAAIAIAYQEYKDLPQNDYLDFDYFREAVDYLLNHNKVLKGGVGCIGVSKGGDIVLTMAKYIPEVRCAVWINGCNAVIGLPTWIDHHTKIPAMPVNMAGLIQNPDGTMECAHVFEDPIDHPECVVPIDKANAEFLFLVGLDDRDMNSSHYANLAVKMLREAKRENWRMIRYPGTGHLLEPPYSPHCYSSYHRMMGGALVWGGELRPHCEAQEHAWAAILTFLRKHLVTTSKL